MYLTHESDISPLKDLQNLEELYVDETQVVDLSPLKDLQNLEELDLSKTAVSDLSPLKDLQNLAQLDIHSTQVNDLTPLKKIIERGIEVKWKAPHWQTRGVIEIDDTPLSNPPLEIAKQGNEAILRYWAELK